MGPRSVSETAVRGTVARAGDVRVDIIVLFDQWNEWTGLGSALEGAARAAADGVGRLRRPATLTVALEGDDAVRQLNARYRGQDKPTNVLSFPAESESPADGGVIHLGDIVLAYETVAREAVAEGKPFAHHAQHLVVHGTLHVLGFDHETDAAAAEMESLETRILEALGVPDPYAAVAPAGGTCSPRDPE